jgi:uncharacterized membrane protein YozB (DUF420 family)
MSSRRLLLASLLLALAMACVVLALRAVTPAFAASDRPGGEVLPRSAYVPLGLAAALLLAGVGVLLSAFRK